MLKKILTALLIIAASVIANISQAEQLLFASDVIRHGARTATHYTSDYQLPNAWTNTNIPPGQLTQYGFYQLKTKGRFVRSDYQTLLPLSYSQKHICIRSDTTNRTIMSAIAVMTSLYPKANQFNVEHLNTKRDPLLQPDRRITSTLAIAPGWLYKWQHSKLGYPLYKQLYQRGLIKRLCPHNHPTNAMHCFEAIKPLADAVASVSNYCKHSNSHCSASHLLGLSEQQMINVSQIKNWYSLHSFLPSHKPGFSKQLPLYNKIGQQTGCPLVNEIIHNMQSAISGNTDTHYVLYAAHDGTLLAILSYLISNNFDAETQLPLHGNPGFAAGLSFQLSKPNLGEATVRVLYRNNPYDTASARIVYDGSFKRFIALYYNGQCLSVAKQAHRCDYL